MEEDMQLQPSVLCESRTASIAVIQLEELQPIPTSSFHEKHARIFKYYPWSSSIFFLDGYKFQGPYCQ